MERIEDQLVVLTKTQITPKNIVNKNIDKDRPIFKTIERLDEQVVKLKELPLNPLINELMKRLDQLDISKPSTSGTKIINTTNDYSKMKIEELENIFKTNENLQHIKMHNYQPKPKTRNYYLKPTLLDIQYKERGQQY